jgi:hypothetical protein
VLQSSIHIAEFLGTTLHSRDKANALFEKLSSEYQDVAQIHLNFKDVQYMSRSFADGFHKAERKWISERQPQIFIEHVSLQVFEMLDAVSKTQKFQPQTFQEIESHTIESPEELEEFLAGL